MKKGIVSSTEAVYKYTGYPNYDKNRDFTAICLASANCLGDIPQCSACQFVNIQDNKTLEGYIFPDTYRIYADATVDEILAKILRNFKDKVGPEIVNGVRNLNPDGTGTREYINFDSVVIMASVLEKEARTPSDMAMVADIFWRRAKSGWALQSCATVNYITGKNDPGVTNKDRAIDSLYNTYLYPGLPIGPISNPGLDAFHAAMFPQKNNYWYFMTGKDGQMHYARTLEEHNANVARYLR